MLWLGVNREAIISLVFERGAFSGEMVQLVALALLGSLPAAILLAVNQILSNGFYAMDMVKVPALIMPLGTLLYVPVAAVLTKNFGIFGLALSSTFAAATVFFILIFVFGRQLDSFKVGMGVDGASLNTRWWPPRRLFSPCSCWSVWDMPAVITLGLSLGIGVCLYAAILMLTKDLGISIYIR